MLLALKRGMEKSLFTTDISAKFKSVTGMTWYDVKIVKLSKTGAALEGRFVQRQDTLVELVVPSSNPAVKTHYITALVVAVEEGKLFVRFL